MPQTAEITVTWDVPEHIIYNAMTDQMALCQMSQGQAVSEKKVGGQYMLFGGTITGEYISLEDNKRIEMKWKFKEWPEFGNCVITFNSTGNAETEVLVKITGIPEHDEHGNFIHLDTIQNGWKSNIFKRIHQTFGYPLQGSQDF